MSISRLLFLGFGLLIAVLTTLSIITYTQLRSINASVAATDEGLELVVTQREPMRRTGFEMEISSNELAIVPLEYFRDRSISMTERIKLVNEAFKKNYGEFQSLADDANKLTGAKVNENFDNLKRYAEESVARHDDQFNQLTEMYAKATALEDILGQLQQADAAEQMNQEQVDRLRAALRMQVHLNELRLAVRTYQVDRDPKYRQEVRDTVTRFNQLAKVYADANPSAEDLVTLQRIADDFKVLSDLALKIMDVTDTQSDHFDKLRQEFAAINKTLDEELQPNIQRDVDAARLGATTALDDAVKSVDKAGWVLLVATLIGIAVGGGAATVIAKQITRPVANMVEAAEALAQGDLTRPALDEGTNETGRLAAAFNQMVVSLRSILGESKTISAEVASASNEIATGAQQQLASLNQTAASLNQITTTAEEFKATMQEFADRARAVQEAADDTTKQTADGRTLTQEAASRIKRVRGNSQTAGQSVLKLSEQMQRIGEITATVNEIAEQTKLLALNASIEAARAGEDGRGFAVVATQVRELANQSKESAGRIEALIGGTQKSMQDVVTRIEEGSRLSEDSVDSVQQMAQAFDEIAQAIEQTREAMSQINTGARQQEDGIVELVSSITEIDSGSRESVAAAEQTQKAIVAVDQRIRALNESIARFRT